MNKKQGKKNNWELNFNKYKKLFIQNFTKGSNEY